MYSGACVDHVDHVKGWVSQGKSQDYNAWHRLDCLDAGLAAKDRPGSMWKQVRFAVSPGSQVSSNSASGEDTLAFEKQVSRQDVDAFALALECAEVGR